jgi:hypothetical protein
MIADADPVAHDRDHRLLPIMTSERLACGRFAPCRLLGKDALYEQSISQ